jgi:alpha-glucosidase
MRGFRRTLDSYPGQRMAVGEVWVADDSRWSHYVRDDELNLVFNFKLVEAPWGSDSFRDAITASLAAMAAVGASSSWVLSNHDVERHATRYGGGALGLRRARAAALLQVALPGAAYLYNGDELGLANVELPDDVLQDPIWERTKHAERGRDGERVPLPWSGTSPPYGFTTGPTTWLPMPADWAAMTVEAESADPASTLSLYRRALAIRREDSELRGDQFAWIEAPEGCLSFRRGPSFVAVVNTSSLAAQLPAGEVLLSSEPLEDGLLPPNAAAWLRD